MHAFSSVVRPSPNDFPPSQEADTCSDHLFPAIAVVYGLAQMWVSEGALPSQHHTPAIYHSNPDCQSTAYTISAIYTHLASLGLEVSAAERHTWRLTIDGGLTIDVEG